MLKVQRDGWFGWCAYTLSRSRRRDFMDSPTRIFDHDQPHNLITAWSKSLGPWSFGAKFRLASGHPLTPVIASTFDADNAVYLPTFGAVNSERAELAHQLDVRVDRRFQFRDWQMSAYIDVRNVYGNARFIDYVYSYDYREREKVTDIPFLPSFGVKGSF